MDWLGEVALTSPGIRAAWAEAGVSSQLQQCFYLASGPHDLIDVDVINRSVLRDVVGQVDFGVTIHSTPSACQVCDRLSLQFLLCMTEIGSFRDVQRFIGTQMPKEKMAKLMRQGAELHDSRMISIEPDEILSSLFRRDGLAFFHRSTPSELYRTGCSVTPVEI